jgi:hypothetical protein
MPDSTRKPIFSARVRASALMRSASSSCAEDGSEEHRQHEGHHRDRPPVVVGDEDDDHRQPRITGLGIRCHGRGWLGYHNHVVLRSMAR